MDEADEILTELVSTGLSQRQTVLVAKLAAAYAAGRREQPEEQEETPGARRTRLWRERHKASQNVTERHETSQCDDGAIYNSLSSIPPIKKERKKEAPQNRKHPLPDPWEPSDSDLEYGRALGLDNSEIAGLVEEMRLWAGSTGAKKTNWHLAAKGWMRREAKKLGRKPSKPQLSLVQNLVSISQISPEFRAWETYNKKPFAVGRTGTVLVPTRWPPGWKEGDLLQLGETNG